MTTYVEYHDVDALDYLPLKWRPLRPVELARTPAPPIGGIVLLITGIGTPKRYHVWERYRVRGVETHDEGTYLLRADCVYFSPPVPMTDLRSAVVFRTKRGQDFSVFDDAERAEAEVMTLMDQDKKDRVKAEERDQNFWMLDDTQGAKIEALMDQEEGDRVGAEERFWSEIIGDRPHDADPYGLRAELRRARGATDLEIEDLRNYKRLKKYVPFPARKLGGEPFVTMRTRNRRTDVDDIGSLWRERQKIISTAGRPGQGEFRKQVLVMFGGTCLVTGCAIERVVQAAHLVPYSTSRLQKVHNGIALRADVHTLFDLHTLRIDSRSNCVHLQPELAGTEYWQYNGKQLTFPSGLLAMQKFREALIRRWQIANATAEDDAAAIIT